MKKIQQMKRESLLITWDGIKQRNPTADVRKEWDRYVLWRARKKMSPPQPTIKSIIEFECKWLKSLVVTRISNPEKYKEKEKIVSLVDIQSVCDLLLKRKINTTDDECKKLLLDGVSVLSIQMWLSNGLLPKNPAFKVFLASKGVR